MELKTTISSTYRFRYTTLLILLFLCTKIGYAQNSLKVYDEKTEEGIILYADNAELFPYTLKLDVKKEGLTYDQPLPEFIVVPGGQSRFILTQLTFAKNQSWKINYSLQYMEGDANAIHNEEYVYQLPFKEGRFVMSQGYNGRSTHAGINALDFTMPEGEIIVAARNGLVVKIKEDSNRGCPSNDCMNDGNFIRILHDDGTMAEYHHLQLNGVLVEEGAVVKQGQEIGKCGATGFATGSHLHFVVFKTDGVNQITIQTKFKYAFDKIGYLRQGIVYKAF